MIARDRYSIYLFSFLLAFCSLFYEYVYAQILSVCIGGTKFQYLVIISLFTSALGVGSLLQGKLLSRYEVKSLFFVIESCLIVLGSLGPFFIAWLLDAETGNSFYIAKIGFSYFLVFVIGVLSGFEIPCLFTMLPDKEGKILAYDYLGMLVASFAFPFLFLHQLGTAAGTLFVANINALALIWLWRKSWPTFMRPVFFLLCLSLFFFIWYSRGSLNHLLTQLYLGEL